MRVSSKRPSFKSNLVSIRAGPPGETEIFTVHEDFIKDKSPFFKAAFEREWKESRSREISLQEDATTVETYLAWVYTEKVSVATSGLEGQSTQKILQETYMQLARLYAFGELIQDDRLCDEAIKVLLKEIATPDAQGLRFFPALEEVKAFYDGTPSGSPARRLMVHLHIKNGKPDWIGTDLDRHHPEFLLDLSRAFLEERPQPPTDVDDLKNWDRWMKTKK